MYLASKVNETLQWTQQPALKAACLTSNAYVRLCMACNLICLCKEVRDCLQCWLSSLVSPKSERLMLQVAFACVLYSLYA